MRDELADGWKISQVEALVGLPRRDIQRACYEGGGVLASCIPRTPLGVGACTKRPIWQSSSCWRRRVKRRARLTIFGAILPNATTWKPCLYGCRAVSSAVGTFATYRPEWLLARMHWGVRCDVLLQVRSRRCLMLRLPKASRAKVPRVRRSVWLRKAISRGFWNSLRVRELRMRNLIRQRCSVFASVRRMSLGGR